VSGRVGRAERQLRIEGRDKGVHFCIIVAAGWRVMQKRTA
jgi:hypothetical protein